MITACPILTLMPMDIMSTLRTIDRQGIALIRQAHGLPRHRFPKIFSTGDIKTLTQLGKVLFGRTKFTARQRVVVELAETNQHAWTTLAIINKHARTLPNEKDRWRVWNQLVSMTASEKEINAAGKKLVQELAEPAPPRAISHTFTSGPDGMTRGTYVIPTDQFHATRAQYQDNVDKEKTFREGEGEAFLKFLQGQSAVDDTEDGGPTRKTPRTILVITASISAATKVIKGKGNHLTFGCSDGTVITGQQLLNQLEFCEIMAGLFHETLGPIELHRFSRFANEPMRILATAETMCCATPGCGMPAERTQIHHIVAWKNGGETNQSNTTLLCARCNGRNDDDPDKPLHGRIIRHNGKPMKLGTWKGAQPQINTHPRAMYGAMHILKEEDCLI